MKTCLKLLFLLLLATILGCSRPIMSCISNKDLEQGFKHPDDSIQTSVYWYWISGNISKEGVVKDLESMKQVGINRAFIGNIGLEASKVKLFSDDWWEITHAALKRASELGIDIGLFNCPGWSQAGGPWTKPEQSMRYLTSVKAKVVGGKRVQVTLERPNNTFQDVKVIAYPYCVENEQVVSCANATIVSKQITRQSINKLVDGNRDTEIFFIDKQVGLDIALNEYFPVRSLTIYTAHCSTKISAEWQVKEGNQYKAISQFEIDRTNPMVEVGFDAYAPIVISLPKTPSKEFRLVFTDIAPGSGIQEIQLSAIPKVERYSEKTLAKMHQTPLPYWKEYQWKQQADAEDTVLAIDPEQIIDISSYLMGDVLTWDVPEGEWQIERCGMLPTLMENGPAAEEGRGLEVDKMTSAHLQHHFDSFLGKIMERIPAADRTSLKICVADSYEKGGQNFTDTFFEDFKERYGYDALPFLPVFSGVVVLNHEASNRFLWDMRRMVADKLAYEHIGAMRDLVHKYGLTLWLENYGHWGFTGEFLQYGGQSDEVAGEFWSEGELGDIENRAASSCAHIYGKTKVSAESFTCGGEPYSRYPATMKQRGDRFFSEGINNTLLHVYISQPQDSMAPGMNAPFGNEFNRLNTWFPQMDMFVQYLKRTNFMLQQGLNVADVAYFIGEDTPKMTGVMEPELPKGYQFDYINSEVIIDRMFVKDGLLTLPHGTQYKVLVLPQLETMRPELLAKIRQLVNDGGVVLGPSPSRSPSYENYPQADAQVKALASELWGQMRGVNQREAKIGKGLLLDGMSLKEVFALIKNVPDCKLGERDPVLYNHRTLGRTQLYFLTNQSDSTLTISPEFRVKGLLPELWEATSGCIRKFPAYTSNECTTTVPLKLESYESVFVVFREEEVSAATTGDVTLNYPSPVFASVVSAPWTLSFDHSKVGPSAPVRLEKLVDLSTLADDSIKYYSGTVNYATTFQLGDEMTKGKTHLQLGDVAVMAKVKVNGHYVGGLWTAPYRLDISDQVVKGENQLEIEVVTTWVNRLIGDSKLPVVQRSTYLPFNTWTPQSNLQKSGLIGPVVIEIMNY